MSSKQRKAEQRRAYKEGIKKLKHGHGTNPMRKKDMAALGR